MLAPAATPNAFDPCPFLKWVGSKRQLVPHLHKYLPGSWRKYHEPFVGGGAMFFSLCLTEGAASLSDTNDKLIRTYREIRSNVASVIGHLEIMRKQHSESFYYETRERFNGNAQRAAVTGPALAAAFIYLNKTGFNGLYRVNADGRFNVPIGNYKNPAILDAPRLLSCARALQDVELVCRDFRTAAADAQPNDFVYFDPPYVPTSATSNFTSYGQDGFSAEDQVALRDLALDLKRRGVHVLLSNSAAARPLYERNFEIVEVFRRGTVSSKGSGRQPVAELIIR